jgi:uncharacterized protein
MNGIAASMAEPLSVLDVRVLGSLVEKEATTPDNYPLTLNALTAACNQTTNREPVMHVDEAAVLKSIEALTERTLVRAVHRSDSRARRYRHLMTETLKLHQEEIAVMCVLMLRGAQTVGEIRTRSARLFEFPDLARVDITLQSLMTLTEPLVVQLPRRAGQKEVRYAHLLSGEPQLDDDAPVATVADAPAPREADEPRPTRLEAVEKDVEDLRAQVTELRALLDEFRRQFE